MPQLELLKAGAKEITNAGKQTRNGIPFTRYTFRIDDPTFAAHVQKQLEQQLFREGVLPLNGRLQPPEGLTRLSGAGELWVDEAGLPLRLIATLNHPEESGQETRSGIKVTFRNFGRRPPLWHRALADPSMMAAVLEKAVPYRLAIVLIDLLLFFTAAQPAMKSSKRMNIAGGWSVDG